MVDLFDGTCLLHTGNVAATRDAMRGLRPMQAPRLLVRPGRVYDASTQAGHMVVLSFDDGMCGTVADDVDAGSLLTDLAAQMRRRGIAVSSLGSAPAGTGYRLEGAKVHLSLVVDMRSVEGRTQVSMLAMGDGR